MIPMHIIGQYILKRFMRHLEDGRIIPCRKFLDIFFIDILAERLEYLCLHNYILLELVHQSSTSITPVSV